jgi:YggT family protein
VAHIRNQPAKPQSGTACTLIGPPLHVAKLKLASKGHLRMNPFIWLLLTAIDIYIWIVIIMVIMSWLIAFNVLNTSNNFVRQINYALHRITEPLLGPIRRILPEMGGIDLSPLILFVGLQFLKQAIYYYLLRG